MAAGGKMVLEAVTTSHPFQQFLPDFALRKIVRSRLSSQLSKLYGLNTEDQLQSFVDFVQALKNMPISSNAEAVRDAVYEIPVEVFKLFLGKSLKFSCLYYRENSYSIEQAENAMIELYCARAEIQDGHKILDIGSGYGSLALYIAHKFPSCHITAMSYSTAHKKFIEGECRKRGLKNMKAIDCDIAIFETTETYDRIFAIQILEHLHNYHELLKKLSIFMKPDALLFIENGCHKFFAYDTVASSLTILGETRLPVLGENVLLYFQDDVTIVSNWRVNGTHQGKTSDAWRRNIDKNYEGIHTILANTLGKENASKWIKNIRNHCILDSEMYNFNNGEEWLISHQLFKKKL